MFNSKIILITGGTGSFGSACVKYLLKNYKPKKVIVFSRDELKQYEMLNNLLDIGIDKDKIRFFLGDVRDKSRLKLAFQNVDFIIHAAALKQIPAAEYNPQECIKTNINGAENVILSALESGVKKVIALSTDKACNPINLYGATKLASDKLFVSANSLSSKKGTRFSVVRYGNVVDSRGSVIPLFKKLISQNKKSLPITDENMTRFFINLNDGVKFVLNSFARMHGGEIFVPKLPSVYIRDIVKALNPKLKYHIIGIRPGEKLHEVLCTKEESRLTIEFDRHYVIQPTIWSQNADKGTNLNIYMTDKTKSKGKKVKKDFEYNSLINKNFLNISQARKILGKI
tara:strand:- start:437 stop:1462 length:1026 start_codon:yes stop_codon:yes gene_type:complete